MRFVDCAVDTTDRLSSMCPLMGIKLNSGTADAGAAVEWPNAEVARGLDPELADSSLVFTIDSALVSSKLSSAS